MEITLEITPRARFDVVDVRQHLVEHHGPMLDEFPRVLYCSYHTTAGYLDQRLVSRLNTARDGVTPYLRAFQTVFPAGAGYRHDELDLREELSEEQRRVEPRNGDSHLAFIGAGLRTCVTYEHRPQEPVYFIDLDGVNDGRPRQRLTSVMGYSTETLVALARVKVPVTARAVASVNLKDPCLGLFDRVQELIERYGVVRGRIQMTLADAERDAALTINEYETLLMQHDLPSVIRNPFRFMGERRCRLLASLRRIRTRAMTCTRFLRLQRSISLLVTECGKTGRGHVVQGRFQSPILVQWGPADGLTREIDVSLTQFR
jgi:hypothetical protein